MKVRSFPWALGLWALTFFTGAAAAEPVKIGVLLPPAGTGADISYLRGAEIAAAEVNANEGRQGTQILLLIKRGSPPARGDDKALRELFFKERINFLMGAVDSRAILPACRLAREQRIPFLVFPLDFMEGRSTGEEPSNLFWMSPAPEAFQRAAVRTAVQFPQTRIYLLARNSESGRAWVRYFGEELKKHRPGSRPWGETFLPTPVEDYRPYIQSILASTAEVCLSHLGTREWVRFYEAARKEEYFKNIVHLELEAGELESLTALNKKVPEGIWGVSPFPFWALDSKESTEFVARYKNRTNSYPGLAALSGYISVQALFEAVRRAGGPTSEKVAATLEGMSFRTPIGQMSIRKTDHRAVWPIWVGSLKRGSGYPFPILGNLKALGPESLSP